MTQQPDNPISLKEIFEKVIVLETKVDAIKEREMGTTQKFTVIAAVILVLEVLNLVVHFFF